MSGYDERYHRAEVLDRWANIYGHNSALAQWTRFAAAGLRFNAEVIKAARLEELADWIGRRLPAR